MTTEAKFNAAVDVIKGLPKDGPYQPSHEMRLLFYGLYKQATEGPCTEPKPSFYQVVSGYKWKAWTTFGSLSKIDAMERYVMELKKIVETMSYSSDVAAFMEVLGSFYEYVEVPGGGRGAACPADDGRVTPLLELEDGEGAAEVEVEEEVAANAVEGVDGVPYRNGHLRNGALSNGVLTKAFLMTPPATPSDCEGRLRREAPAPVIDHPVPLMDRPAPPTTPQRQRLSTDSDTEDEYSEPSESLPYLSGCSDAPLTSPCSSGEYFFMPHPSSDATSHTTNTGATSHTPYSGATTHTPHIGATNHTLHTGATTHIPHSGATTHTPHADATNHTPYSGATTHTLHTGATSHTTLSINETGGQPAPPPTTMDEQHVGQGGDSTVVVLRQMQGDLQMMVRCLQEHLNDISQCLAALHRTTLALQTRNGGSGGDGGGDDGSCGVLETRRRRQRQWWPFPELSPRSTFWLLLWPLLIHLLPRLLLLLLALRRRRK